MNNNIRLFFAAILFLMTILSTTIQAQDDKMVNVMFPNRATLQKHTFDSAPVLIKVDEGKLRKIAFNIPIPAKEWQRMPAEEFTSGAKTLAGFIHPKGPDKGTIQVMEYRPPYDMTPSDWLLYTLEQGNMKVITSTGEGIDGSGPFFEALAVSKLPKGSSRESIMMRAAVYRHGDTFVLVRCMASPKSYLEMAYYFGVTIHRFEFQNNRLPVFIGQWERRCIDNYCFNGPKSDYAVFDREAIVERSLPLSLEGARTGLLNISVARSPLAEKTPAQSRINNLLYNIAEKSGMSFNKDLAALKGEHKNLGGTAYYARSQGFGADKTAIDFFALSWEGEASSVLIYMLTDAREKNPVAWMVNKRTFEIISQSFSNKVE